MENMTMENKVIATVVAVVTALEIGLGITTIYHIFGFGILTILLSIIWFVSMAAMGEIQNHICKRMMAEEEK